MTRSPDPIPATDATTSPLERHPYVHVDVPTEVAEEIAAELFDRGATGVEERDGSTLARPSEGASVTLIAHFPDADEAGRVRDALGERFPARLEFVEGDAWRDAWKSHFHVTRIGARLVLRPSWEAFEPARGDVVLVLDPGRAFGTGTHESTRLVLAEVERLVRGGERVLDAGTGSGILAIAALLLGAAEALGTDVDRDALAVAVENATLNGVEERFRSTDADVAALDGEYELVLANIEARVLVPMAASLARRVAPGGTLVLSGLLAADVEDVARAYASSSPDLVRLATPAAGEWAALVFERPSEDDAARRGRGG